MNNRESNNQELKLTEYSEVINFFKLLEQNLHIKKTLHETQFNDNL